MDDSDFRANEEHTTTLHILLTIGFSRDGRSHIGRQFGENESLILWHLIAIDLFFVMNESGIAFGERALLLCGLDR